MSDSPAGVVAPRSVSRRLRRFMAAAGDQIRGVPVRQRMEELRRSEHWDAATLRAHQEQRLLALLRHCYEHVPFYRRRFDELKARPEDFATLDAFREFPTLGKDEYTTRTEGIVADHQPFGSVKANTGGSTGEPLVFYIDRSTWAMGRAANYLSMTKLGYEFGDPIVTLVGGSLGRSRPTLQTRLKNLIRQKREIPAFELSPESIHRFAPLLRMSGGTFLRGYPTSCYSLARLWEKEIGTPLSLGGVFTTSETLHSHIRDRIETVFHTRVLDQYGCGEVNGVSYQCPTGGKYHVFDEHVIMEMEETGDPATGGRVILTDLDNYAMPLIRYLPEDRISGFGRGCPCGVERTTFDSVLGRTAELMITTRGSVVEPTLFPHVFRHVGDVQQFQVRFIKGERVEILVVPGDDDPQKTLAELERLFAETLPEELEVTVKTVDAVQTYPSGKTRFIVVET